MCTFFPLRIALESVGAGSPITCVVMFVVVPYAGPVFAKAADVNESAKPSAADAASESMFGRDARVIDLSSSTSSIGVKRRSVPHVLYSNEGSSRNVASRQAGKPFFRVAS